MATAELAGSRAVGWQALVPRALLYMVVNWVALTFGVTLVGHVIDGFGSTLPGVTVKTRAAPLSSVIGDWMGFMYWKLMASPTWM